MPKAAPRLGTRSGEYAQIIEVVRLYYEQDSTQSEISEALGIPQASVSRLLQRAADEGIVRHVISPPTFLRLQTEVLARIRSSGVRDVRVVPVGGDGSKNAVNLGVVGAEYLWEAMSQYEDTVSVCMACGDTLLGVIANFAQYMEQNREALKELRKKTITLYPLNLFWPPVLEFGMDEVPSTNVYPSALVVYLAMQLNSLGCKVVAHAPQSPLDFYREFDGMDSAGRTAQVQKYSAFLTGAKDADIFLLGIGTGLDDPRYGRVLSELNSDHELDNEAVAGEINYQPFRVDGEFIDLERLIAVRGEELVELAGTDKHVISVAGGGKKVPAMTALLNRDILPFNVLITDESIAGRILDGP